LAGIIGTTVSACSLGSPEPVRCELERSVLQDGQAHRGAAPVVSVTLPPDVKPTGELTLMQAVEVAQDHWEPVSAQRCSQGTLLSATLEPLNRPQHLLLLQAEGHDLTAIGRTAEPVLLAGRPTELTITNWTGDELPIRGLLDEDIDRATALRETDPERSLALLQETLYRAEAGTAGDLAQPWFDELRRTITYKMSKTHWEAGRLDQAEHYLLSSAQEYAAADGVTSKGWWCPYQALGELYSEMGRTEEAQRFYEQALQVEPWHTATRYAAALELFETGEPAAAGEVLRESMRELEDFAARKVDHHIDPLRIPDDPQTELHRFLVLDGMVALQLERYDEALARFRRVLSEDEDHLAARAGLGHLAIVRRDHAEAQRLLTRVATTAQPQLDALATKGGAHMAEDSRFALHTAALGLGWAASNQGRHAEALDHFEGIIDVRPQHFFAQLGRGNALNATGAYDEAQELFEALSSRYPDNPHVMAEWAATFYNQGDLERAEQLLIAARDRSGGGFSCPYEGLGLVHLRQGHRQQAKGEFQQAIEINPDHEFEKYVGLARIYLDEGREDEARALLHKALENHPGNDAATAMLAQLDGDQP